MVGMVSVRGMSSIGPVDVGREVVDGRSSCGCYGILRSCAREMST